MSGITTGMTGIRSIANTIEGGTHLTGFRMALTRTLKSYADPDPVISKQIEKAKIEIAGEDFREGLTAVISIKVAEPQFEGQTKTKLGNSEVAGAVQQAVGEALANYLEEHPKEAKQICDKVILASSISNLLNVTKSKVTKYNLCNLSLIRLIVFQTVRTVRSFVRSKTLALQTMALCAINYGSFL